MKAHPKFQDGNGEKVTKQQRDRKEISSRDVGREKGEMRRGFINHQPGDWQPQSSKQPYEKCCAEKPRDLSMWAFQNQQAWME